MTYLFLTVRFLDDRYHGQADRGGPVEWPPSPFRLFQALVAGVARRGEFVVGDDIPSNQNFTTIGLALGWLQTHSREHPPIIIAPKHKIGQAITRFVPNNDGDKKFDRQERLTAKPTIPTLFLLEPDQRPEVHYAWPLNGVKGCPLPDLERAARSLTTLGWGIDMAFADARLVAEAELQTLKGVRWHPKPGGGSFEDTLRVPTYDADMGECTLCDLRHCHSTMMNRIEHGKPLKTVDKPKVFDRVLYTSIERPINKPVAVFTLVDDEENPVRYPHARLMHLAAMVRHLAIELMTKHRPSWKSDDHNWVERFVRGKAEPGTELHPRLSYVPLPSIGHDHADAMVRNVMLVVPNGYERELDYLAERLRDAALKPESDAACAWETECRSHPIGNVRLVKITPPAGKFIDKQYLGKSRDWHSVTPLILDGHDDKKPEKTIKLIQHALERAGIQAPCEFTWQSIPFLKNCLTAHKYDRDGHYTGYHRPKHLKDRTAIHVRIAFGHRETPGDKTSRWIPADHPVPGPITLGAGRHCGFGLMAAID